MEAERKVKLREGTVGKAENFKKRKKNALFGGATCSAAAAAAGAAAISSVWERVWGRVQICESKGSGAGGKRNV